MLTWGVPPPTPLTPELLIKTSNGKNSDSSNE